MTPETNALIPVGIAALCFLLAFLYGRHRRALALRRRVAESFGQMPAEPERPRAMTREFWELLRAGEPAGPVHRRRDLERPGHGRCVRAH